MTRPETTLLLPISADGRVLTQEASSHEIDPSWRATPGVRAVLAMNFMFSSHENGEYTLVSAEPLLGLNTAPDSLPQDESLHLVIIDHERLNVHGKRALSQLTADYLLLPDLSPSSLARLSQRGVRKLTITSSLKHNHYWFTHTELLDHLSLLMYPLIVGGRGEPIFSTHHCSPAQLTLKHSRIIESNYVNIQYDLVHPPSLAHPHS